MWPRRTPQRVGTLSDLIGERRSLRLVCNSTGCRGEREIDIERVIAEHGDMRLQRFAERSRCVLCGAREPRTICPPLDTGPTRRGA
jgi:hypothetical protein